MILEVFRITPPDMVAPSCSKDLLSTEADEPEVVEVTFNRASSKFSLRVPKQNQI